MLDKVQEKTLIKNSTSMNALYRCNFCSELLTKETGNLNGSKIFLHNKQGLLVACSICIVEYAKDMEDAINTSIKIYRVSEALTYEAINNLILKYNMSGDLRIKFMQLAHFVGDRPSV